MNHTFQAKIQRLAAMDIERSPEVTVHFQQPTSTLEISDTDFALKIAAAAAKVKARQSEECVLAKGTLAPNSEAARLSSTTEDEQLGHSEKREVIQASVVGQGDHVSSEAHPGDLVQGPFYIPDEPTDGYLSDTASTITERPSGETQTTANDSTLNLPTRLAIKQRDGSYKDLTSQIAIKRPDGSYMDLDLEDITPFGFKDDADAQLDGPTYQATPEIAPWLHQQGATLPSTPSRLPRSQSQTPPSKISKASKSSSVISPKSQCPLPEINDHGLVHFLLRCRPIVANKHVQLSNHPQWQLYSQADHIYS
jgi:hypothetical protein